MYRLSSVWLSATRETVANLSPDGNSDMPVKDQAALPHDGDAKVK